MKKLILILITLLAQNAIKAQCWEKITAYKEGSFVIAIADDSTLWHWGKDIVYTPTLFDTNTHWIDIDAGELFYAAIKQDSTLWMWGLNNEGQFGDSTYYSSLQPLQVNDHKWISISCGQSHTVGVRADSTLWVWGNNDYGQLNSGLGRTKSNVPIQIGTNTTWIKVSAGETHSLAMKNDHSLWSVGYCHYSTNISTLHEVGGNSWVDFGAGGYWDFAIKNNGTLWKWKKPNGNPGSPNILSNHTNWTEVQVNKGVSPNILVTKTDHTLWSAGNNAFGQEGNDSIDYSNDLIIQQVGTDSDWEYAVVGEHFAIGVKQDYKTYAWGRNTYSQFGNSKSKSILQPVDSSKWTMASASDSPFGGHSVAIKEDSTLWSWGLNESGSCGYGNDNSNFYPTQIGNDTWNFISTGTFHSIGIKSDSTLWGWGRNNDNQLGVPSSWNVYSPIVLDTNHEWIQTSSGNSHTIALKNNGTLWAWGRNNQGQIGDYTTIDSYIQQIGTDTTWTYVDAGNFTSFGIKEDSTLWSWGSSNYNQLARSGNNTIPLQVGVDKWLKITAGGMHIIGIKSDSTLWGWGYNQYGQNGGSSVSTHLIDSTNKWADCAVGTKHSLGRTADGAIWGWGYTGYGNIADSNLLAYASSTPYKVREDLSISMFDGGTVNSILIDTFGTLYTCGDAYNLISQTTYPQLGYTQKSPLLIHDCGYCIPSTSTLPIYICASDSFYFNNQFLNTSGAYQDTLLSSTNCDSIITLQLTVYNEDFQAITDTICMTDSVWIGPIPYHLSGVYIDTLVNSNGCDSIIELNLLVLQPDSTFITSQICNGDSTLMNGDFYISTGEYENTTSNQFGCDSTVFLDLEVFDIHDITLNETLCAGDSFQIGQTYYTETGFYKDTLTNNYGCDSIISLDLNITTINAQLSQTDFNILQSDQPNASYQWLECPTYTIIPNATSNIYEVMTNGEYAVEVTYNGCIDTSLCYTLNTIGELEEGNANYSYYPNPVINNLHINITNSYLKTLEINSIAGLCMTSYSYQNERNIQLPMEDLIEGTYFIKLIFNDNSYSVFKVNKTK